MDFFYLYLGIIYLCCGFAVAILDSQDSWEAFGELGPCSRLFYYVSLVSWWPLALLAFTEDDNVDDDF